MRLLRGAVLAVGFGVLALSVGLEHVLSRRDRAAAVQHGAAETQPFRDVDRESPASLDSPSAVVTRVRLALGVLGVGVAVWGGYVVLRDVNASSYLGLALWLVAAVVLHDGVLVPAVSGLRAVGRRATRRLPVSAFRLLIGGFLVGGVITLIAVPEIYAQHLGTSNPTVLPGSYGQGLLVTWLVVVVLTALGVAAAGLRARRRARSGR